MRRANDLVVGEEGDGADGCRSTETYKQSVRSDRRSIQYISSDGNSTKGIHQEVY